MRRDGRSRVLRARRTGDHGQRVCEERPETIDGVSTAPAHEEPGERGTGVPPALAYEEPGERRGDCRPTESGTRRGTGKNRTTRDGAPCMENRMMDESSSSRSPAEKERRDVLDGEPGEEVRGREG